MSNSSLARNATIETPAFAGCSTTSATVGKVKAAIAAQSGRCYGIAEGQTADVFGGCCPYEGLALEAEKYQKTSATDNFSTVQNVTCAYLTCTVSTKAAFDALKECVVGDKLNPPRVWRSSDTFPLCSFYEKEQKAASSANAVRFGWAAVIVGVLSFSIVLNGSS